MSSRWLREIGYDYYVCGTSRFWQKCVALWLRYVMDFSLQADVCASGKSWVSTEKTGTHGSFDGSSFNFVETVSTPFASSDRGKVLVVNDPVNPENCGIYVITAVNSTSSVLIDFRAGTLEYPTVAPGNNITWYVCGGSYQCPSTNNDYCRLQSRHSTGWAVELTSRDGYYTEGLTFKIATTGSWSGPVIGNLYNPGVQSSHGGGGVVRMNHWMEGDYDNCEWVHFIQHVSNGFGTGYQAVGNQIQMISIERVTPIESGLPDADLLVLKGALWNIGIGKDYGNRDYLDWSRGLSWCTDKGSEAVGYSVDYSYSGYASSFARQYRREQNMRRGNLLEAFYGEPYIIDPTNVANYYRYLGYLKGH